MAALPSPGKVIEVQVNESCKKKGFLKNGTILPPCANDDLVDSLQEFVARDDDVWICAYPKAGTHWIWEVVTMLLHNRSELVPLPKEYNMVEARGAIHLEELPCPRVLNSHLPVRLIPSDVWKKQNKIIYIIRNPKDSLVSLYLHYVNSGKLEGRVTLHELYNAWYSPDDTQPAIFDGWLRYNIEWQKKQRHTSNVPLLKYEDVRKDHLAAIRTIATFLNCSRDEDSYKNIQEKTSLSYMKNNKVSTAAHPKTKHMDNFAAGTSVYRKGIIEDWKNHFTVALNEEFDKDYEEQIKDSRLIVELN